jgi:hypothetical protein
MYMYFSHPSISVPLRLYPLMNGDFSLLSLGASSFCNGFSLFNFAFHHDFSRFTLPLFLPPVNGFRPNVIFMVGFRPMDIYYYKALHCGWV